MRGTKRRRQSRAWLMVLGLLTDLTGAATGQVNPPSRKSVAAAPQEDGAVRVLEPGKSTGRELVGGVVHAYRVALTAGQYLHVVVDQQGIDVVVTLFGPDGHKLAEIDSPNGMHGPEPLLAVVAAAGVYRLEVRSLEKSAAAGQYKVWIEEPRAATEQDRKRIVAHEEASRLRRQVVKLYGEGKYEEATPLAERAQAILEEVFGGEHSSVADALNNLAELYSAKGDYARVEPLHRRALAIREKLLGAEHPNVTLSLNNLGALYFKKGDYIRARQLFERALAIRERELGAGHPSVALSLNNLALVYKERGDYLRAEPLYQRALTISEKALGAEHPAISQSLNNLAELYRSRGDYVRAEPLYQRDLAIAEKVLGAEHPNVATSLNNLAVLYRGKGDYVRAELLHQRSLAIFEKVLGAEHPLIATSLNNLAQLYFAKGDTAQAVTLLTRANDLRERTLDLILSTGSENQKRLYMATLTRETAATVSLHINNAAHNPDAARLALTTILRRKGRVLDASTDQLATVRRRLNPQDRTLLEQLSAARARLAGLVLRGPGKTSPVQHRTATATLEVEAEQLEAAVSSRSAGFRLRPRPVTLADIQQALPADAALVELLLYQPYNAKAKTLAEQSGAARYAAYVLHGGGAPLWVDLGAAAVIDAAVAELRAALSNPLRKDVKQVARAVDEQVMRPVRRLLGTARHVFVSPDGALNLLPFAALVDEQGKYLVENYSITYLTAGRDLLRSQVAAEGARPPVVIADPSFDQAAAEGNQPAPPADDTRSLLSADFAQAQWGRLEGAAAEAAAIKAILPGATVLTDREATEAALKQVAGPRILHVATHGFFLPDGRRDKVVADGRVAGLGGADATPGAVAGEHLLLRSGLILAGANKRRGGAGEDGILTALEAAGLDLSGTQMVVLSACETGIGTVQSGEGVYGLRRALVLAGAESQVVSLWQIKDEPTRELMVDYYKRLLQAGEGRTEALRAAQLTMLRGKRRRHPFYWAAFIQSGEWRPLTQAIPGAR